MVDAGRLAHRPPPGRGAPTGRSAWRGSGYRGRVALPDPAPTPPAGYLDAVAGQPVLPAARAAWAAATDLAWSDPARLHHLGRRAGAVLDAARAGIAAALGARAEDVALASSGPTAVALALQGLTARSGRPAGGRPRIVVGDVESLAVTEPAGRLGDIVRVPVDGVGRVDLQAWSAALDGATVACLQAANGEVGTRQPLEQAAELARAAGVPLLVHAIQAIGHDAAPAVGDVVIASARDWGGPAGVGAIAVRPDGRWRPDVSPDRGWAAGFPDVPAAAGAAAAWEYLAPVWVEEAERHRVVVDRLRAEVPQVLPGSRAVGDPRDRLPHVVTFAVDGVVGEALVGELDRRGVMVATGSACTTDRRMPSQVLAAMGIASDATLRIALPYGCTDATVDLLLSALPEARAAATA